MNFEDIIKEEKEGKTLIEIAYDNIGLVFCYWNCGNHNTLQVIRHPVNDKITWMSRCHLFLIIDYAYNMSSFDKIDHGKMGKNI